MAFFKRILIVIRIFSMQKRHEEQEYSVPVASLYVLNGVDVSIAFQAQRVCHNKPFPWHR
jgi:hypothetical protein